MGACSKVTSVVLRLAELSFAIVVLGLVGHLLYIVGDASEYADARLIYTTVVACISIALSLVLLPPFTYSFLAFPVDFILFVLWLVSYCLLQTLTGTHTCDAVWYWSYWGYYWGGFWGTPVVIHGPFDIDWAGCSSWKAVLAFNFISFMTFLASSALGFVVILKYREEKRELRTLGKMIRTAGQGGHQNGTGNAQPQVAISA